MKKSFKRILVLAASLILALCMAVPVFADLDQTTADNLKSSVQQFLEQVYTMDEDTLQQMKSSGGFYEVFYNSWEESRDEVGEVQSVEVKDVKEAKDGTITVTSEVQFAKRSAEVLVYFDGSTMQPTNYEMNISYTLGEKLEQAAQNMAVGLIVVFAILVFLTIVIYLFRFIPHGDKSKKAQSDLEAPAAPASRPAAAKASAATAAGRESDDELVAVMAAAIAAAMEEAPVEGGYVVRSIRRVGTRGWKRV